MYWLRHSNPISFMETGAPSKVGFLFNLKSGFARISGFSLSLFRGWSSGFALAIAQFSDTFRLWPEIENSLNGI